MYPATITSQGQMSIPAAVRRLLNIGLNTTVLVSVVGRKAVIEPVSDFMSLGGTFKTKKKYSQKKVDEGFAKYMGKQGVGV